MILYDSSEIIRFQPQNKYFVLLKLLSMKEESKITNTSKSSFQRQKQRQTNITLATFGPKTYYSTCAKEIAWFGIVKKNILICLFENSTELCLGLRLKYKESQENANKEPEINKSVSLQKIRHVKKEKSTLYIMFNQTNTEGSWRIYFQTKQIAQRWYDLLWLEIFYFKKYKFLNNKFPNKISVQQIFKFDENRQLKYKSIEGEYNKSMKHRLQICKEKWPLGICYFTIVTITQKKRSKFCLLTLLQNNGFHFFGYADHVSQKAPIFLYVWPISQVRSIHQYQQQNTIFMEVDRGVDMHQIWIEFYNRSILERWLFLMLSVRQFPDQSISIQKILKDFDCQTYQKPSERQQEFFQEKQLSRSSNDRYKNQPQAQPENTLSDIIRAPVSTYKSQHSNGSKMSKDQQQHSLSPSSTIKTINTYSEQSGYYNQLSSMKSHSNSEPKDLPHKKIQQLESQLSKSHDKQNELEIKRSKLEESIILLKKSELLAQQKIKELLELVQTKDTEKRKFEENLNNQKYHSKRLFQNLNDTQNQKYQLSKNLNEKLAELTAKLQRISLLEKQNSHLKTQLTIKEHQSSPAQLSQIQAYNSLMKQQLANKEMELRNYEEKVKELQLRQKLLTKTSQRYLEQKIQNAFKVTQLLRKLKELAQDIEKKLIANISLVNISQDLSQERSFLPGFSIEQQHPFIQDKSSSQQSDFKKLSISLINELSLSSMNQTVKQMLDLINLQKDMDQAEPNEKKQFSNYSLFWKDTPDNYCKRVLEIQK